MADASAPLHFTLTIDGVSAALDVAGFELAEAISELFELGLRVASAEDIAAADVLGKTATLSFVHKGSAETRHVSGIVARFGVGEHTKNQNVYALTVVPAAFRLTLRHDCRIFQAKTVPEILEKVLVDVGAVFRLQGSYPTREYCVQYRESDFAFASRLMEEEGIHYVFEHSDGGHEMVVADRFAKGTTIASPSTLIYRPDGGGALQATEHVRSISQTEQARTGKVSLSDFNFKKPNLSLMASASGSTDTELEVYDFPGEYLTPSDGSRLAKVRLEELEAARKVATGEGTCERFVPGHHFTLAEHPREPFNADYLICRVVHRGSQAVLARAGDAELGYSNRFEAIAAGVPFRPRRLTPRPTMKGVQTAIVTGPSGEEIHVDEHGRVKVHFHWDRQGKKDDQSSCWVRVSQPWAGPGWGAMFIPRIGHEVVVDFIEGDPDQPIIVGRVYHGTNVPPYPLPAEKTKSTIRSDSSPGSGGNNELRFEDKKGSEEIWLHGQKDWNIKIENDKTQIIGHDQKLTVGNDDSIDIGHDRTKHVAHDQAEAIDHDKSIQVGHDHTETIGNDESLTIAKNATREVGADQSIAVGANQTVNVGANLTETVGAALSIAVGAAGTLSVAGAFTQSVGASSSENVGGAKSITVAKSMNVAVSENYGASVAKDMSETVEKKRKINVGEELTMTVGDGSISIKKDGTVTVTGKDITVKGSGKINVKADGKIILKADGPVDVESAGKVVIKGSAIEMN